jgi:hypothetical protein
LQTSGGPGNFALEVVLNLSTWTLLANLTAPGALLQETDPRSDDTNRHCRVWELP